MTYIIDLVYDGEVFHPVEPLTMKPDTRYCATLEELPAKKGEPGSALKFAMSLKLEGPSDFSSNLDHYLYGHPKTEDE